MKRMLTLVLFFLVMYGPSFGQHKWLGIFNFEYPTDSTGNFKVTHTMRRDTITEGVDYVLSNPAPLPSSGSAFMELFTALTGSHFGFPSGSIPGAIDSMEFLIAQLNPARDTTQPVVQNVVGQSLWLYFEVKVHTPDSTYDQDHSYYFTPGYEAYFKIPITPELENIFIKTFGSFPSPTDTTSLAFAFLNDGQWKNDGIVCEMDSVEIRAYFPHFSKIGGGGRGLKIETSAVEEWVSSTPAKFNLAQNYPNPFNPATKIAYSLPNSGYVTLKVFNTIGTEVKSLISSYKNAGSYEVNFDAGNLPSGIYFYSLSFGNEVITNKMMLIK